MALTDEKYQQKRRLLVERTSQALSIDQETATRLLSNPRIQSVRINTLVMPQQQVYKALQSLGAVMAPSPLMTEGYYIASPIEAIRDSTLNSRGEVYIQNAASWLPVIALNARPGEAILDMCAAPGGKTSHIAQMAHNQAIITANDNSRPRLHKLRANLERLGAENIVTTLHDATRLARHFESESFDKILLDAPCSGEGMMTLDSRKDFESWSVAHIKRLQQLQKKLIVQAWQLLKPGGTLIYSTCTMAPEENEAVIDYLLRHNDDVEIEELAELARHLPNRHQAVMEWNGKRYDPRIKHSLRLIPSDHIEAFFVAKLRKK